MPLHSFPKFKLVLSRHKKELRGALGHDLFVLCVNPSLVAGSSAGNVLHCTNLTDFCNTSDFLARQQQKTS